MFWWRCFTQESNQAEGRPSNLPYKQYSRNDKLRGMYLNYNRIILGVRLSQERYDGTPGSCPLQNVYGKQCVGGQRYELEPDMTYARRTSSPKRITWLYIHEDQSVILDQVHKMEKEGWLDDHTQKIEVAFPVYNAEYGLHTLVMFDFFFSRGGRICKDVIPLSAFANWFEHWYNYFYDISWVTCIVWIIFSEVREILKINKEYGASGLWTEYVAFWNMIDWFSVATALGIGAMFAVNYTNTNKLNQALKALGDVNEQTSRDATVHRERHTGMHWKLKFTTSMRSSLCWQLPLRCCSSAVQGIRSSAQACYGYKHPWHCIC